MPKQNKNNNSLPIKMRPYQKEASEAIEKILKSESSTLLKMTCGSGKTWVYLDILIKKNYSIIVFPRISLITQIIKDYLGKYKSIFGLYNQMSICSYDELSSLLDKKDKQFFSTKPSEINDFLKKNKNQKKIICTTYKSLPTLVKSIKKDKTDVDLIIYDEGHHTIEDNIKDIVYYNQKTSDIAIKTLFSTATPRTDKDGYLMIDRKENKAICGSLGYEYTMRRAIKEGYAQDFKILVDFRNPNEKLDYEFQGIYQTIAKAIINTHNCRILTFHSFSEANNDLGSSVNNFTLEENIKLFETEFNKLLEQNPQHKSFFENKKIRFNGITGKTETIKKYQYLEDFDNFDIKDIQIISSCRSIGEGFDTKYGNMTVFVDTKSSTCEIQQNVGRIVRKPDNKEGEYGYVVLPVSIDMNSYLEIDSDNTFDKTHFLTKEIFKTGNLRPITNVLSALRQDDPEFYDLCLEYPDTFSPEEVRKNLKRQKLIINDDITNLEESLTYLLDKQISVENYFTKKELEKFEESEINIKLLDKISEEESIRIIIHNQSMKSPKNIIGKKHKNSIRLLLIEYEDNIIYSPIAYMLNDKIIKICSKKDTVQNPTQRKFKIENMIEFMGFDINWSEDEKINLSKSLAQLSVKVDVQIISESKQLEYVQGIVDRYKARGNKLPRQIYKKNRDKSEETRQEYRDNQWIGRAKNNKMFLYPSTIEFLDKEIPNWNHKIDRFQEHMNNAQRVIKIYIDEKRILSHLTLKGDDITLIDWLRRYSKCYNHPEENKNRANAYFPKIANILCENVPGWNIEKRDRDLCNLLTKHQCVIDWCISNGKFPTRSDVNDNNEKIGWYFRRFRDVVKSKITSKQKFHPQIFMLYEKYLSGWRDGNNQMYNSKTNGNGNTIISQDNLKILRKYLIEINDLKSYFKIKVDNQRLQISDINKNNISPTHYDISTITNELEKLEELYYNDELDKTTLSEQRNYQHILRNISLKIYKCCVITKDANECILDCAHIKPVTLSTNEEKIDYYNTLLLRSDIHNLFDNLLITINPDTLQIEISNKIKSLNYAQYNKQKIKVYEESKKYLEFHYKLFLENN